MFHGNLRKSQISTLVFTNSMPNSREIIIRIERETNIKLICIDISEVIAKYIHENEIFQTPPGMYGGGRKAFMH